MSEKCPYCGKEKKAKRRTCGEVICQHEYHKSAMRSYWHNIYKKIKNKGFNKV